MTYESLLSGLTEISDWFVLLVTRCLDFISQYPLAMLAVIVVVVFPFVPFIFSFIQDFADSSEGMANSVIDSYKLFKLHKKKKEEKKHREAFIKEKQNKQVRAYQIAQEFFKNNPNRMSISIMGFKFYQDGFENKNWSNSKKTRVTKKYKIDSDGELVHSGTTVTSTESYDNTSDLQLLNNFDAD